VDELGAELDRYRDSGQAPRIAAPADPRSRFDGQDRPAGTREGRGGGKAGGAGPDDDDVVVPAAQAT
jgi:hypothetical protein